MINRGLLLVGVVLAIIGAIGGFAINSVFARPTDYVMAASADIPAGTYLSEIPEDSFVQVPITFANSDARLMLNGLVQPNDLIAMRAANGVLIKDIYKYEPIVISAIVSSDNPAASRIARLGLDNPDFMVITIPVDGDAPTGLMAGDRVDLAVTISSVAKVLDLEQDTEAMEYTLPQSGVGAMPPEALAALIEESGYTVIPPEGETGEAAGETGEEVPAEEPEGPTLREPVTKLLVNGALVLNVQYETSVASVTSSGEAQVLRGGISAIDVVIPRDAFEFVTMAMNSGNLQIGLLSPLVGESIDEPTLGASLQDFLDLFVSDREELTTESAPAE